MKRRITFFIGITLFNGPAGLGLAGLVKREPEVAHTLITQLGHMGGPVNDFFTGR